MSKHPGNLANLTHFTKENAAEMARRSNEARRKKRERMQEIAEEVWAEEIRTAAREHIALLREADTDATKLAAIKEFYDRNLGKTSQAVEFTGEDGGPMQIVVRSAFELDSGDQPAVLGDGTAERPGEGVD